MNFVTDSIPHYSKVHVLLELTPAALQTRFFNKAEPFTILEYQSDARFWSRGFQDGRSSVAIAELISQLQQLPHDKVSLNALMSPYSENKAVVNKHRFDSGAKRVLDKAKENELVIILVGNLHASRKATKQFGKDNSYNESFASFVEALSYNTITFEMKYSAGTAWQCYKSNTGDIKCGERQKESSDTPSDSPGMYLYNERINGYDGFYHVGEITASKPLHDVVQKH